MWHLLNQMSFPICLSKIAHLIWCQVSWDLRDFLKQTCLTRCDISVTRCLNQIFPISLWPKHLQHLFKHQISWNLIPNHVITISTNQIPPDSQILWKNVTLHEKYFHLCSSADNNSSAKNEGIFDPEEEVRGKRTSYIRQCTGSCLHRVKRWKRNRS